MIAIVGALIVAIVGGSLVSTPNATVVSPASIRVEPLQMMANATNLPTERFHDLSLVFD